ncbi:transcriptional regulator, partial [Streptomyces asiaticus]
APPGCAPRRGRSPPRSPRIRTPARIARELGRPAFHTLIDIRRLAAAGHVATPRATRPEHPGRPGPPAASAAFAPPAPDRGPGAAVFTDPDIDLLRRLRDALEASL